VGTRRRAAVCRAASARGELRSIFRSIVGASASWMDRVPVVRRRARASSPAVAVRARRTTVAVLDATARPAGGASTSDQAPPGSDAPPRCPPRGHGRAGGARLHSRARLPISCAHSTRPLCHLSLYAQPPLLEWLAHTSSCCVRWRRCAWVRSAAECAHARAAIDDSFGPAPCEAVGRNLVGFASQTHSSGYMHSVCHPNPAMACLASSMDKMTRAHCEFLRSDRDHIKLNGFSLIRTDPYRGGDPVLPHHNPTNIHIDNAFLARHDLATPREVYSRSIVYLNEGGVSEGGAPIIVWPRAHRAVRRTGPIRLGLGRGKMKRLNDDWVSQDSDEDL
jgi:hypothetical protein